MSVEICGPETELPPVSKLDASAPPFFQQIYRFVSVGALAIASYFVISHFFLQSVQVVGVSMVPTLQDSDHYFLNRWIYHVRGPHHGDIVVIRDPLDNGFSVKRIVGVEGDAIFLRDGNVYLNGTKLNEPYLPAGTPTFPCGRLSQQLLMCGKNQFLVLGDNRKNSADGRTYGVIGRDRIVGMLIR